MNTTKKEKVGLFLGVVFQVGVMVAGALDIPTYELMTYGGDDRLLIRGETGLNKYNSLPVYLPDLIMRSSSTVSFCSEEGFSAADDFHAALLQNSFDQHEELVQEKYNAIGKVLQKYLNIRNPIVFTPSGTTSEYLSSLLALEWAKKLNAKGSVCSIIPAAGEVGSLSACASEMKHFSSITPRGDSVQEKAMLDGFSNDSIEMIELSYRSKDGKYREVDDYHQEIKTILERVIVTEQRVALLHLIHGSKTGAVVPQQDFVASLKKKYGEWLVVVVDSAQMRLKPSVISDYLRQGYCIFGTGSKFFGGPPFSGFMIFTEQDLQLLDQYAGPIEGLKHYFSSHELLNACPQLSLRFDSWKNYSLLLRWVAAATEITLLEKWIQSQRGKLQGASPLEEYVAAWYSFLMNEINDRYDRIIPLVNSNVKEGGLDFVKEEDHSLLGNYNTIVPCQVKIGLDNRFATTKELKMLSTLLMKDCSSFCAEVEDKAIAKQKVLIGQPVAITSSSVSCIRLVLGAQVLRTFSLDNLESRLLQDRQVLEKIQFVAKHFDLLTHF